MSKRSKSTAKEPFLPLFVGDFLGATAEWDGEERALYLLLLGYQWTVGSLPADPRKLRKLVDYQVDSFEKWWPTVSTKFQSKGDRLVNVRLEVHRKKTLELSGKNAESGKKGAQARWGKNGERHEEECRTLSDGMALASLHDNERHQNAIAQRHTKSDGAPDGNPSHPIPSHPISLKQPSSVSSGNVGEERARSIELSEADHHAEFVKLQNAYPPFAGRQNWLQAELACRNLIEQGTTWTELQAGLKRYSEFVAKGGTSSTKHVLTPANFFGAADQPWRQAWPLPTSTAPVANPETTAQREQRLLAEEGAREGFRGPRDGENAEAYRAALKAHVRTAEERAMKRLTGADFSKAMP